MVKQMTERLEREGNKQCIHYWKIDRYNVGHCIKPGCSAVKDFGALLKKEQRVISERQAEIGHSIAPDNRRGGRARTVFDLELESANMVHSEKRYCPVCKEETTFICKDKGSGYFCSVCGYRAKEKG